MDHDYIEKFDLVDRYLMGKLEAEESELFEEHFLDCPRCVEQLKTTGDFIKGLKLVPPEQYRQADGICEENSKRHITQLFSRRLLTVAAILLLTFAFALIAVMFSRVRSLEREAKQAKAESAEWQRRYEERANDSLPESAQNQKEPEGPAAESEPQPQSGQQGSTDDNPAERAQPQINIPIAVLHPVRRGKAAPAESENSVALPRSATDYIIALVLEDETRYSDYHASIQDAAGRTVWKMRGLRPIKNNFLSIRLGSTFLRPGDYTVTIEGRGRDGSSQVVGSYPLRIVKGS